MIQRFKYRLIDTTTLQPIGKPTVLRVPCNPTTRAGTLGSCLLVTPGSIRAPKPLWQRVGIAMEGPDLYGIDLNWLVVGPPL